jgi:hypothetical protein
VVENGKKLIVVLVSKVKNSKRYVTTNENVKSNLETKLNKMIDSVSLAIIKIHNIINNDSNIYSKEEFINSILVSLTNEFPEFKKLLNPKFISKPTRDTGYASQGLCHANGTVLITSYKSESPSKLDVTNEIGQSKVLKLDVPKGAHVGGVAYHKDSGNVYLKTSKNTPTSKRSVGGGRIALYT